MHRSIRLIPAFLTLLILVAMLPAKVRAENKDMIELKTQMRLLQDAIARLQQSNDERMGVMRDLVQQTTDSVNRMQLTIDTLGRQVKTQSEGTSTKVDSVNGQMQSLNDSLDELKARLGRMEKSISDLGSTQQSISARLAAGSLPTDTAPVSAAPVPAANPPVPVRGKPSAGSPLSSAPASASPLAAAPAAPPAEDLYRTAFGDYNGAKVVLATAEFNDLIHYYPDSNLSGNAYFYLGEMDYKAGRFGPATRNYDKVIEQYPGNVKIPVAQLRKGESLIALKQTDAGARELRSLVQRFPNSPEAVTAKAKLATLGGVRGR